MRRKKGQERDAPASRDRRITPDDVQQVEFRLAFRGYNERDVDAFLDRVTEDLASYLEETGPLRSTAGGTEAPTGASVDTSEPDRILARAREEAAEIVRRAEQQAEAIRGATGAGDARAAVAPFLSSEREFLQGLGSLIQSHAEEIRQMVHVVRTHTEPSAAPATPGASSETPDATSEVGSEVDGSSDPEAHEVTAPDEPVVVPDGAETTVSVEQEEAVAEEPIVVERAGEPALSSDAAPAEGRERSLRELFWGEE